ECSIDNCYSTGSVSGSGTGIGGLTGYGTATNSFWNVATSGQSASGGGTYKTSTQMKDFDTYTDINTVGLTSAWDFIDNPNDDASNDDIWDMDQGGSGYPILTWQVEADDLLSEPAGSGTEGDPYQITTLDELGWISDHTGMWDKYYEQTTNIDAAATSSWDSDSGFTPIGNSAIEFTGSYNGQGYTIDNLFIDRDTPYTALFGYTNSSDLDKIGLTNVDISGQAYTGALVGRNYTTQINECYSTGSISGTGASGGLVGANGQVTTIENCYSTAGVNSTGDAVGGLVGDNYYATATINNCYSTGNVVGATNVGGLVGAKQVSSVISNSFWNTTTSNQGTSVGGAGKTTAEMKNWNTYTDTDAAELDAAWDFIINPNNDAADNDLWDLDQNGSGYPIFSWQSGADAYLSDPDGTGASGEPYEIANVYDLHWLMNNS
ncbi:MAG: hypothetical protein KAI81_04975, partial [Candidatus Marinimicrobia bacterium]|nr:hypothetical protein [Candidatus Neomarinimicrobiota bacterium]